MSTSEQSDEPQPPDSYAEFLSLRNIGMECLNPGTRREG